MTRHERELLLLIADEVRKLLLYDGRDIRQFMQAIQRVETPMEKINRENEE